jgi:hypothetical protein
MTREFYVLALEVSECLFGGAVGVLPDRAFAGSLADEDSSCLVNAPPGSLIV